MFLAILGMMIIALGILGAVLLRPDAPPDVRSLVLVAIPLVILSISLDLLAYLAFQRAVIYENGITPAFRPAGHVLRRQRFFIPFGDIRLIGARQVRVRGVLLPLYCFVLADGSIAVCNNAYVDRETSVVLERQLGEKCPGVRTVALKLLPFDEGVRPRDMPGLWKKMQLES